MDRWVAADAALRMLYGRGLLQRGRLGMDGSKDPVLEIGKVLRKHVDRATLEKVIEDLQDVPGNKSFRDAIERLSHELLKREAS